MNCHRCQHDLSMCLDGRLPSGQRKVVMGHVDECDACTRFWQELQSMREIVSRLPQHGLSPDFRDRLFERIESGEGTPPAVFEQPIPQLQKLRYVATGALAAAALLLVSALVRSWAADPATPDAQPLEVAGKLDGNGNAQVASGNNSAAELAPRTDNDRHPTHDRIADSASMPSWTMSMPQLATAQAAQDLMRMARPLTADLVGVEAARQFSRRVAATSASLEDNLDKMANESAPAVEFWARNVCENAVSIKDLGELLIDLRTDNQVVFDDSQLDVELRVLVDRLRADHESLRDGNIDAVRKIVAPVLRDSAELVRLPEMMTVKPTQLRGNGRQMLIFELSQTRPQVFQQLFMVLPGIRPESFRFEVNVPGDQAAFDICNPIVAPRSEFDALRRRMK
jgi:hypothetical protein